MKLKIRREIFCMSTVIISIILLSTIVDAETIMDETGNVEYVEWVEGTPTFVRYVNDKPNLDITEISYQISGVKITITLKVLGTIEDDEDIVYHLQFISEEARYFFLCGNGEYVGSGESYITDDYSTENPTVSDDTISCTFDWYGENENPTGQIDFQGSAVLSILEEYDEVAYFVNSVISSEWYGDEYDEEDGEEDETDDGAESGNGEEGGTPGFMFLTVLAALSIVLILFRKRKKS